MKKVSKKTKVILFSIIIILALAIIAVGIIFFLPKKQIAASSGEYYPANYDENIFLNQAYLEFQRDVLFNSNGVEQLLSYEKDFDSASRECQFFLKYFHTVINGDYEAYKDFFIENYFDEDPKFTMQMIYDPFVRLHSSSVDQYNDSEVVLLNFEVRYRIFKNNKTYRSDVDSNVAVPQIYQLIKLEDGSYRIFRILNVEVENDS